MADIVYVDGNPTAHGESETGVDWAHAYLGATGLQVALDSVANGNETIMYLRTNFAITATIDIDAAGGLYTGNRWLTLVGCDAAGDQLTRGDYLTLDAGDNDLAGPIINRADTVDNIRFKHIWLKDNHNGADSTDTGITIGAGASYNTCLIACKVTGCSVGVFNNNGTFTLIDDCVISDVTRQCIVSNGYNTCVINCHLTPHADFEAVNCYSGGKLLGCTVVGGIYGLIIQARYTGLVYECSMYNQSNACIENRGGDSLIICRNSIFWVAAAATDYVIKNVSGSSDDDFCWSNATTVGKLTGDNSVNSCSVDDIGFADPANGDFRLKPTSICLNNGKPSPSGGFTSPGSWQRKSLLRCA